MFWVYESILIGKLSDLLFGNYKKNRDVKQSAINNKIYDICN